MVIEVDLYEAEIRATCSIEGCKKPRYGRGLCKAHHQWHWRRGNLPQSPDASLERMFSDRVMWVPESGCAIWVGPINSSGYGRIRDAYAHRVAWEVVNGPIPQGMNVCHRCDTPACVNPSHLFLGTHQENMWDSAKKGRARQPSPRYGVEHPRSRLSTEDVQALRSGAASVEDIARKRCVHPETARRARDGITYRNLAIESPIR